MGRMAQPDAPMKVAGKTGTALTDEGPWTHAWFAGYAPAEKPEIVLVVFLEKGHGGTDAASVAREIFAAFAVDHDAGVAESAKGARK
jgi:cell division protein FtsI/penicillin-binding protein 2